MTSSLTALYSAGFHHSGGTDEMTYVYTNAVCVVGLLGAGVSHTGSVKCCSHSTGVARSLGHAFQRGWPVICFFAFVCVKLDANRR